MKKRFKSRQALLEDRKSLPIYAHKQEFFDLLDKDQCILVVGETGSGKTTQVPQWCVEYLADRKPDHGMFKVCCTQPRRLAAISVANRVAQEVGDEVGYSIRFEECTSSQTVLKYATDGMLLREIVRNSGLIAYGIVILDEAHERGICNDILIGYLKKIVQANAGFKIVVMSATADAKSFQSYLWNCPLLNVSGRTFPVDVYFLKRPVQDYIEAMAIKAVDLHCCAKLDGDILIFVTGQEECEEVCRKISQDVAKLIDKKGPLTCIPLYSTLPIHEQQRIFDPPPEPGANGMKGRKCVVATNIAETSLTIDGVSYVLDCGFCKEKIFQPRTGIDSLLVVPISKAQAIQRAGRAGRTTVGECYRFFDRQVYDELEEHSHPEIMITNLTNVLLFLKRLGIENLVTFDYMTPPTPAAMIHALDLLYDLGAINEDGNLTDLGNMMAAFPLDPPLAKVLIASTREEYQCSEQMTSLVALLSSPPCFIYPLGQKSASTEAHDQFFHMDGDHLVLINVFFDYVTNNGSDQWCFRNFMSTRTLRHAKSIQRQLLGTMERLKLPISSCSLNTPDFSVRIRKCLLEGFFHQVAVSAFHPLQYFIRPNDTRVKLHPKSVLKNGAEWILYHENFFTHFHFLVTVSKIEPQWMFEVAPRYYEKIVASMPISNYYRACLNQELDRYERRKRDVDD